MTWYLTNINTRPRFPDTVTLMGKALSILGLVVSSISAIWLALHDIRERNRNGDRLLKRRDLSIRRNALKAGINNNLRNLATAFADPNPSDPSGEKYRQRVHENTSRDEAELQEVERQIDEIDEEGRNFQAAWASVAHLGGFGLLLLGFMFQRWAEILKP